MRVSSLLCVLLVPVVLAAPAKTLRTGDGKPWDVVSMLLRRNYSLLGRVMTVPDSGWTIEIAADSVWLGTIPDSVLRFNAPARGFWLDRGIRAGSRAIAFGSWWPGQPDPSWGNLVLVRDDGSVSYEDFPPDTFVRCGTMRTDGPNGFDCITSTVRAHAKEHPAEWLASGSGVILVRVTHVTPLSIEREQPLREPMKAGSWARVGVEEIRVLVGTRRTQVRELILRPRVFCDYVPAIGDTLAIPALESPNGALQVDACVFRLLIRKSRIPSLDIDVDGLSKRIRQDSSGLRLVRVWSESGGR